MFKINKKKTVDNITRAIREIKPKVKDQLCHSLLKSDRETNSKLATAKIELTTTERPARIEINPPNNSNEMSLSIETLDNIRSQAGLSSRKMQIVSGGIRSDLGRQAIPSHYREHVSSQINFLKDYFYVEKHNFITETKSGLPTTFTDMWCVWAPIVPLIVIIFDLRENTDKSDYLIKVMADTGKGTTKVCFSIIPFNECTSTKKRTKYVDGGILAKRSLDSGINKCIICFCVPEIKEVNWNFKKIFELINMDQLLSEFKNVIFAGDFKLLNEVYGLMACSSKHPCIYCTAELQTLQPGLPRKIGGIREDFDKWEHAGRI